MAKLGRPPTAGLGHHKSTGQYRKIINGREYKFGTDREQALARYQFFLETGLHHQRGHGFCLQVDGRIH